MSDYWHNIVRFIESQGSCTIVTVVELFGSGPREIGARLIVAPDGSFVGTIGGGTLEWQALAGAQAMLPTEANSLSERKYGLGPDLGQCCGGFVTLSFETLVKSELKFSRRACEAESRGPLWIKAEYANNRVKREIIDPLKVGKPVFFYEPGLTILAKFGNAPTPIYLFGAGHVGKALVKILPTLSTRTVWLDSRNIADNESLPANVEFRKPEDPVSEIGAMPDDAYVFVMTHSHALDFDLCLTALSADRFRYVGVIGSKTKKARFESRLREAGITEAQMKLFHSPLGLGSIGGKEPAVIAVSIAADLILRIEQAKAGETVAERTNPERELYRESS